MPQPAKCLGFVPSLEVLPLFEAHFHGDQQADPFTSYRAHSGYGSIARGMLTGELAGGILHWEIFIAEVLALPGQRALWATPLFLRACPTEILVRDPLFKCLYPSQPTAATKLATRLVFGVASRSSLTQAQIRAWLSRWPNGSQTQLIFKVLPMDLMLQAIKAEMLDGIIVPAPWGMHAEALGLGKIDPQFAPGPLAQKVAMICRRDALGPRTNRFEAFADDLTAARLRLRSSATLHQAAQEMARHGRPFIPPNLLERAWKRHHLSESPGEKAPDADQLVHELKRLENLSVLPPQVAPTEQTARLLLI